MHAILDKFYNGFIKNNKIIFQPTLYSDKTIFINYLANLSYFKTSEDPTGNFVMNLSSSNEDLFL